MSDLTPIEQQAIAAATRAQANAYAPYSGRLVGASVVTRQGEVFSACNLENQDNELWVCAERSAISTAVALGRREFTLIVVAAPDERFWPPCDKCRQVIREFAPRAEILMITSDGEWQRGQLDDLPSRPFGEDGRGPTA